MNKIKIVYIIDKLNIGGTEKQLIKTIELLNKDRFEIFLFCLQPTLYLEELDLPCHINVLNIYHIISYNTLLKFIRFVRFLREKKIDILQTYFIDANIIGVLAAKIAGIKRIIVNRRDLGFWYSKKLLLILKFINKFSHRFLTNSEAIKRTVAKYEKIPLEKIDVIYNGIDLKPFDIIYDNDSLRTELGIIEDDIIIGIVANLNRRVKRVDLFIEAASIILNSVPNCSFIIIGDGDLKEELVSYSKKLGIRRKIHFVGKEKYIYAYLSIFDIGILTSDSEGFSNSILEYMAAGLPVICAEVGGNVELMKDNNYGATFNMGDAKDLAEKTLPYIRNRSLRVEIKGNNKDAIKRYSFSIQIKLLEKYLENILL